ncbi:hypothetical protein EZV62_012033 [Acer yangbiense]|uniref:Uncharacterized protein n=1 Tax=Acer yangbiense TaxID=1000413 RepID=A0A5C7I8F7_9ROSI|nr:hypothetical protein EZV62_012033 [Acer yangbiense]
MMVQQTVETKFNEYGLGSPESKLPSHDKQLPVAVKKTALRELQNENRMMVPNSTGNSPYSKDRGPIVDDIKVSGAKRPPQECHLSPSRDQSPNGNAANGHLVYVRRRFETEVSKNSTSDNANINADCMLPRPVSHPENSHQKPPIKEPKLASFPALAPLPVTSFLSPSGRPSVPLLGKSGLKLATAESNNRPVASTLVSVENSRGMKNLPWEERYHRLQMLLKKLDQSDQVDYVQMLHSLSSVELSRHAVELEKRSIQLSLEEVKEVTRVEKLNVLGKSIKNLKESVTHQDQSNK